MNESRILSMEEITAAVKFLLKKYNAEYAVLFGSYARGEADEESDVDLIVFGGEKFHLTDVLGFGEELREMLLKSADVFEISEIVTPSPLYDNIMREGVKIA